MKVVSIIILNLLILCSCQSAYYKVWETFGKEKRDLLKRELTKASGEQKSMEKEFKDALARIRLEYSFEGGDLGKLYDKVESDYDRVRSKKDRLDSRKAKIDRIAKDLFAEWKAEANELSNRDYKRDSLQKLSKSKKNFNQMSSALASTQRKLDDVTKKYKDQVIYLKHNLNAKSLSAFKGEFNSIKNDMESLIKAINKSIKESNSFNNSLP